MSKVINVYGQILLMIFTLYMTAISNLFADDTKYLPTYSNEKQKK